jgi:uncharacterized iron-regulated membrane protein
MWSEDHGALSNPTSTLDESLPHSHTVPWALGDTKVPRSDPNSDRRSVANVDTAVAVGDRNGLAHPMTIALPGDEEGVYSVIGYAFQNPAKERTLHVDQYGGAVVSTYGYQDYPLLAKTVAQGIALHEGRRLGTLNMWLTTAFCLAVIFMCITGPTMWWRRRPKTPGAGLGAPRGRLPLKSTPALALLVTALALFLPLFGLTLLTVLLLDRYLIRRTTPSATTSTPPLDAQLPAAGPVHGGCSPLRPALQKRVARKGAWLREMVRVGDHLPVA